MNYQKQIEKFIKLLRYTDTEIVTANPGKVFTDTRTPAKFRFTNAEGAKKVKAIPGKWANEQIQLLDYNVYYFLRYMFAKEQGYTTCPQCNGFGTVPMGGYYRYDGQCPCCDGYKIGYSGDGYIYGPKADAINH